MEKYGSNITAVKLMLPAIGGYVVRNDIIQRRFLTCELVNKAADFTTLREEIQPFDFSSGQDIVQRALQEAVGALLVKDLPSSLVASAMASMEAEVVARLSFPWITHCPLPRKRIAMVDGRPNPTTSSSSQGIWRAAAALGVELVILDHDGHWAQHPSMSHMRDEFISCDLTLDEGLPVRIATALSTSKGPIHGIVTFTDTHLLATSQAAKKMGLFGNPEEAMEMCRDKEKTRTAASGDVRVLLAQGVVDLRKQLAKLDTCLQYPLIVKPTTGCSSDGVRKVTSEKELVDAVRRIEENFAGVNSLIEPYISGPEVDANFVLLNGELIWSEINDDFPSSAEILEKNSESSPSGCVSFAELSTIMPSILPNSELDLIKTSLTKTLLVMGFRNGVYHLEARLIDSQKKYASTDSGIELVESVTKMSKAPNPRVFLIEINPRLPGHQESFAVEYTYGIDYFALHMLMALSRCPSMPPTPDDTDLECVIRALSYPLSPSVRYPSNIVFIPVEQGGTFEGAEPLPEALMCYLPEHSVFLQQGEVVKDPETAGRWPFVAYFLVVGKKTGADGREEVRTIGEIVRQAFHYKLR